MQDLIFVPIVLAIFGVAAAFVRACDRVIGLTRGRPRLPARAGPAHQALETVEVGS